TRAEVRSRDPSANPYLATAVILKAGLSGIQHQKDLTTPVDENIFEMTNKERKAEDVEDLPTTLYTALKALKADEVIQDALGKHICDHCIENKTYEWKMYSAQITAWEKEEDLTQNYYKRGVTHSVTPLFLDIVFNIIAFFTAEVFQGYHFI